MGGDHQSLNGSLKSLYTAHFFPFSFTTFEAFMKRDLPVMDILGRELNATDPPLQICDVLSISAQLSDMLYCHKNPSTLRKCIGQKLPRLLPKYVFLMQGLGGRSKGFLTVGRRLFWVWVMLCQTKPKASVHFVHQPNVRCQGTDPCWKTFWRWHCQ